MKNLILLLALFIPFTLIAQDKVEIKSVKNVKTNGQTISVETDDQTMQWMTKISSDSVMRITMMEMMLEQTKDNEVEMTKLMNTMMANPGMRKIMMATHSGNSQTQINSVEPNGMKRDSIKAGEMNKTDAMIKK